MTVCLQIKGCAIKYCSVCFFLCFSYSYCPVVFFVSQLSPGKMRFVLVMYLALSVFLIVTPTLSLIALFFVT